MKTTQCQTFINYSLQLPPQLFPLDGKISSHVSASAASQVIDRHRSGLLPPPLATKSTPAADSVSSSHQDSRQASIVSTQKTRSVSDGSINGPFNDCILDNRKHLPQPAGSAKSLRTGNGVCNLVISLLHSHMLYLQQLFFICSSVKMD
jgi:hypothetical protein